MNWEQLGLKCGIEIHQQLEGRKLFCNCLTEIREQEKPHFVINRYLRAAAGEAGAIDIAAMYEMQKQRKYSYQGFIDTNCLVELDEMPPLPANAEALATALQVSKMLNLKFVDGVQVMRKTVVDGSNTSGFQRTMLIGMNGAVKTSFGNVGIQTLALEEDSCRNIKEEQEQVTYCLDRLGIPLIEIATEPDIKTPAQCKETAETIGLLLRSTGKAKRGLGTIRQDINVSIKKGARVEIKGAQELKLLPKLVELEAERQLNLIGIKEELSRRNAKEQFPEIQDVTRKLKNSGSKIIKNAFEKGKSVFAAKLSGFSGLIGKEVLPKKRFGTELAERAKVLAGVGGILHSDELPGYGITERETYFVKRALGCSPKDAFVIVIETKNKCEKALKAVIERANEAVKGVPKEVRKANSDATTSYLRPMPGAARMYPETDLSVIRVTSEMVSLVKMPELIKDKAKRYEKIGLGKDLAEITAKSGRSGIFEKFAKKFSKLKPAYIAEVLLTAEKTIKRNFGIEISPAEEDFEQVFEALQKGLISKESVMDILKENRPVSEVINRYKPISDSEIEQVLKKIVKENKGLQFNALAGEAMKKLRGKAPGRKIVEILKKISKKSK